jgi:hypothetical protein
MWWALPRDLCLEKSADLFQQANLLQRRVLTVYCHDTNTLQHTHASVYFTMHIMFVGLQYIFNEMIVLFCSFDQFAQALVNPPCFSAMFCSLNIKTTCLIGT